jgi:hypothetical protein
MSCDKNRAAQESFNCLVKRTLKYIVNFFSTYCVFKNCLKLHPSFSVHNSKCCEMSGTIHYDNHNVFC